jgi:acylphosphatase
MTERAMRRVLISGRVQGVGYREWTRRTADRHGLEGWVRNRTDGRVEAVFVGDRDRVLHMIEACREGPLHAEVSRIEETEATLSDLALRDGSETFSVLTSV